MPCDSATTVLLAVRAPLKFKGVVSSSVGLSADCRTHRLPAGGGSVYNYKYIYKLQATLCLSAMGFLTPIDGQGFEKSTARDTTGPAFALQRPGRLRCMTLGNRPDSVVYGAGEPRGLAALVPCHPRSFFKEGSDSQPIL